MLESLKKRMKLIVKGIIFFVRDMLVSLVKRVVMFFFLLIVGGKVISLISEIFSEKSSNIAPPNTVLIIPLQGNFVFCKRRESFFHHLLKKKKRQLDNTSFLEIRKSVLSAIVDPNILGILIDVQNSNISFGELADLLSSLFLKYKKETGKSVVLNIRNGYITKDWLAFSRKIGAKLVSSKEIFISADGMHVPYFRKAFEKIGLKFTVFSTGKRKTYGEYLDRVKASEGFKEQMQYVFAERCKYYSKYIGDLFQIDNINLLRPSSKEWKNYVDKYVDIEEEKDCYARIIEELISFYSDQNGNKDKEKDFYYLDYRSYHLPNSKTLSSKEKKVEANIAVLSIDGAIKDSTYKTFKKDFFAILKNSKIRGILLYINSPGGGVDPSKKISNIISNAKNYNKKVWVYIPHLAASGGLMIASVADSVWCSPHALIGSIGVVMTHLSIKKLMEKLDINIEVFGMENLGLLSSLENSRLKKIIRQILFMYYEEFIAHLHENLGIPKKKLRKIGDGSVFYGFKAKELGLVNDVKSFEEVIEAIKLQCKVDELKLFTTVERELSFEEVYPNLYESYFNFFQLLKLDVVRVGSFQELEKNAHYRWLIDC